MTVRVMLVTGNTDMTDSRGTAPEFFRQQLYINHEEVKLARDWRGRTINLLEINKRKS